MYYCPIRYAIYTNIKRLLKELFKHQSVKDYLKENEHDLFNELNKESNLGKIESF